MATVGTEFQYFSPENFVNMYLSEEKQKELVDFIDKYPLDMKHKTCSKTWEIIKANNETYLRFNNVVNGYMADMNHIEENIERKKNTLEPNEIETDYNKLLNNVKKLIKNIEILARKDPFLKYNFKQLSSLESLISVLQEGQSRANNQKRNPFGRGGQKPFAKYKLIYGLLCLTLELKRYDTHAMQLARAVYTWNNNGEEPSGRWGEKTLRTVKRDIKKGKTPAGPTLWHSTDISIENLCHPAPKKTGGAAKTSAL